MSIGLQPKFIKASLKISYLANGVLVLTEEGLKFKTFGSGEGSDLSVRCYRHRG